MGCIKAVTRYTLLSDAFLFFGFMIRKLVLKFFKFLFPFWAKGRVGFQPAFVPSSGRGEADLSFGGKGANSPIPPNILFQ